jgi:hypothetical protein
MVLRPAAENMAVVAEPQRMTAQLLQHYLVEMAQLE